MSKKNMTDPNEPDFDLDRFLNPPEAPPKLDDKQVDALEAFLDSHENSMHMEIMDGFFCGLICGPEATGPDEFFSHIFGGKMPEFSTPAQAEEITNLLRQHWQHIEGMMENHESYYPFLYSDKDLKISANDWALGFVLGVDRYRESWSDLLEEAQREENLLTPILTLYTEGRAKDPENQIPAEDREEIVTSLIDNMPKIYHHYDAAREKKNQNSLQ